MTDNNFNETVRLEVQTDEPSNLLPTAAGAIGPADGDVFKTIANPTFATNTTNWAAGSGWTLTRVTSPYTAGQLTRSSSVTAGQLIVSYNENVPASPGDAFELLAQLRRVSTSPASASMQFRINAVAYDASNNRLGVVVGYNGTTDTIADLGMQSTDVGSDFYTDTFYCAPCPAGTSYVRFELLAHNAWTYSGTPFNILITDLQFWKVGGRVLSGWTATNSILRSTVSEDSWFWGRTNEGAVSIESDKATIEAGRPLAVGLDILDYYWDDAAASPIYAGYSPYDPLDDVRIGVKFFDASNNLLSTSYGDWTPGGEAITQTLPDGTYYPWMFFTRKSHSITAPFGAAKASVVMQANGTTFNQPLYFKKPVLIQGNTIADVEDTDYSRALPASGSNRILNPSGELGVQGWEDYGPNSVLTTRDNLPANANSYDFRFGGLWNEELPVGKEIIVAQVTGGYNALYSNTTSVTAGQWVGGGVLVKGRGYYPATGSYIISYASVGWQFRDAADAVISTVLSSPVVTENDYYAYMAAPVMQAPAGTVRARMVIQNSGDSASFTPSNPGAWMMIKQAQMNVGATEASVTNQPLAYTEKWKNILGGTHEIGVDLNELDTGVLTAEILDPSLDPAEFDELVPGLKLRLMALVDGAWTSRFQGSITNAKTAYDVDKASGTLKPRITITAADAGKTLATTPSPNTVNTIDGLANNMPSDIKWNINGKSAVGVNPTVVAVNANASVLDQVMITRDTVGGYAWVDRFGVFNAWDAFNLQTVKMWLTDSQRPDKTGRNENVVTNPYFKTGTAGWAANGGTLTYDSTNTDAKVTATGGVSSYLYVTAMTPISEGQTASAVVAASVPATKYWRASLLFFNSGGSLLTQADSVLTGSTAAQVSGTAPANAVNVRLYVQFYNDNALTNPVAGTVLTVNAVTMVIDPTADWNFEFFNGDDTYCYWTGTANASTSVKDYSLYQDYLTNIEIGYNSSEVINIVNLKVPTVNADGTYDDVPYGPYQDTTSIATWGPQSVEMTIAGGVTPSTVATRILSQNANPERTVSSVTFIVDDDASFKKAATIDLYDLVWVQLAGKISGLHRVAGIQHSLGVTIKNKMPRHVWQVTLYFKALDTAAVISGSAPRPSSTPMPIVPVSASSGTDNIGETSTTFVVGSPQVGTSFVAPLSGIVFVTVDAHLEENTNGNAAYCGFELRSGGTVGSGTVIVAASTDWSVGTSNSVAAGGAARVNGMKRRLITGLTPGATYNVRTMHLTTPAGSVDVFFRAITVEPWM
jgi:hypothetical protein